MGCCDRKDGKSGGCGDAERYVAERARKDVPKAVIACEGACIKGEVARTAANLLTHQLERERSARICLGSALVSDGGMLDLVKRSPEVIAIEGCGLRCGSALLAKRAPAVRPTVIEAQKLYALDGAKYFEVLDMPRAELDALGGAVAEAVRVRCFGATPPARTSSPGAPSAT